jgi:hypothetical protein
MKSRLRSPTSGFEDGRLVENLMVYREHMYIHQMVAFAGLINQIIEENSRAYAMARFHNVVQFSLDRFSEPVVLTSIDLT